MRDELPQRGHLPTEQGLAASAELDALSIRQTLELINDQDATIAAAVRRAVPELTQVVEMVVRAFGQGGRLIYLGAGTSGRLGVLDASECPPTFHCDPGLVVGVIAGGDGALRRSSEGKEDDPHGAAAEWERLRVGARDVVVGIAAGGTTPYVLGGLRLAQERGAATALVACVPVEALAQTFTQYPRPQVVVALVVGPEVVTGSTRMKAGTATKLALNMITTTAMAQTGRTWGHWMVDLRATNAKLRDRAARIITRQTGLERSAALALLERAGGRVKVALVMHLKHLDQAGAAALLDEHQGRLRPVLGAPRE